MSLTDIYGDDVKPHVNWRRIFMQRHDLLTAHGTIKVGGNTEIGASAFPDREPASKEDADMPTAETDITRPDRVPTDQNLSPNGFTLAHPLAQVAIDWHRNQDGEYGCNGITCPAVQRLISFGELCAWTWNLQSSDKAVTHG